MNAFCLYLGPVLSSEMDMAGADCVLCEGFSYVVVFL